MRKNKKSHSRDQEIQNLFNDLCLSLGLCITKDEIERIVKLKISSPEDFATNVFESEGLKPIENISLFRKVKQKYQHYIE